MHVNAKPKLFWKKNKKKGIEKKMTENYSNNPEL